MNFSTLFRTKENLNLDKSILTILRYIAILGQFAAINIVFFYLDLKFPIKETINPNPKNYYAKTKLKSEIIVYETFKKSQTN